MKKFLLCLIIFAFSGFAGAQLATLDVSIGGTGTPATQTLTPFQFLNVVLADVNTDTASGWNSTTHIYTVPTTGLYTITSTLRLADNSLPSSFAEGVNTTLGDGVWMVWNQFSGKRTTLVNTRSAQLTAGTQLQLGSYCDNTTACAIDSAHLIIQQMCTLSNCAGSGTFGGFTSTATIGTLLTTSVANGNTSPAQAITLSTAPHNQVWGGPATGSVNGTPIYRSLVAADMPAYTGDMTTASGSTATSVVKVNGASIPVSLNCLGTNSLGQFIAGSCSGSGGGTNPTSNGIQVWNTSTGQWVAATFTDVQGLLSSDTANNTAYGFATGTNGDSTLPTPIALRDYIAIKGGILQKVYGAGSWSPLFVLSCQPGLGDGLNVIPAGTYPQTTCRNKTQTTWTITAIECYTDTGASTCNVTNGAGTSLLASAITGTSSYAAGTQSATVTIAPGDVLHVIFVEDGNTKQTAIAVSGTY